MTRAPGFKYIKIDVNLPTHPKVAQLNDASFRALFRAWCYCGQYLTDGFIPASVWPQIGRSSARKMLLDSGLFRQVSGGYQAHDWASYQRTRAQWDRQSDAGKAAVAHRIDKRIDARGDDRSHIGSISESPSDRSANRSASRSSELELDNFPQVAEQPETARARGSDDENLINVVKTGLAAAGAGAPDDGTALAIAKKIIDTASGEVRNPVQYVAATIRREPQRYKPAPQPPRFQRGPRRPDQDQANTAGAAAARRALKDRR